MIEKRNIVYSVKEPKNHYDLWFTGEVIKFFKEDTWITIVGCPNLKEFISRMPIADNNKLGFVKIGEGLISEDDGTISVDFPELPIADKENLGIVFIGDNINVEEGKISINIASYENKGVVSIGKNINIDDGKIYINEASLDTKGIVKIGSNIDIDEDSTISVKNSSKEEKGVVSIGDNINIDDDSKISINTANREQKGVVSIGENINVNEGKISVNTASNEQKGVVTSGDNTNIDENGRINVKTATKEQKGVVEVGNNINVEDGKISVPVSTKEELGVIQLGEGLNTLNNTAYVETATKNQKGIIQPNNDFDIEDGLLSISETIKDTPNGFPTLDNEGKIKSNQLPSYVDDVLEYNTIDNFPLIGETGKIYVDTNTDLTYRWSGTQYTEISKSIALGETSSTAYAGDKGKKLSEDLAELKEIVDNIEIPIASTDKAGIVKVGNGLQINNGILSSIVEKGDTGDTGATFTPNVNSEGLLSWTNDKGKQNPNPINIKGDKGDKGDTGDIGNTGITPNITINSTISNTTGTPLVNVTKNGTDENPIFNLAFQNLKGDKGDKGDNGFNGIDGNSAGFGTPIATIDTNVGTPSVTITSSGPDTAKVFKFEFKNLKGQKGDTGNSGTNGINGIDGKDGLCIYRSTSAASSSTTSISLSTITIPEGYTIKIGDLIIANSTYSYLYRVTAVTSTTATVTYLTSIRGATGASGTNGTNGVDGVNGTNGIDGSDGLQGLGIYRITQSLSSTTISNYSKVAYFPNTILNGRTLQIGDLFIENSVNSYMYKITNVTSAYFSATLLISLRGATGATGATGPAGADATIGSSINLPGSPTTTTQSVSDNSTKIATTAYVNNLLKDKGEGNRRFFILNSTADYFRTNGYNRGGTKNNTEPAALYYAILKSLDWGFCCLVGNTPQSVQIKNPTSYANNNNIYKTADDMWVNLVTIDGSESARWYGIKVYPGGDDWYIYLFPSIIFPYTSGDALKANIQSMNILPFL